MHKKHTFLLGSIVGALLFTLAPQSVLAFDENEEVNGTVTIEEVDDSIDSGTNTSSDSAEDNPNSDYTPGLITKIDGEDRCVMEGNIGIPCPAECYNEAGDFQEGCRRLETGEIDNGLSGEATVVCADENEPGCSPEEIEKDQAELEAEEGIEPETWPMILSLSALGVTILFVIIFNLLSRKK